VPVLRFEAGGFGVQDDLSHVKSGIEDRGFRAWQSTASASTRVCSVQNPVEYYKSSRHDSPTGARIRRPWSFRAAMPPLSFRAAGEKSAPHATPGSLAFARDDKPASLHPGLASSFRAATPLLSFRAAAPYCHSEPQARNLRASQRADPSRSLGMTKGSHSKPKARKLCRARRRDPSRCSG
jgi:hypothetical protein